MQNSIDIFCSLNSYFNYFSLKESPSLLLKALTVVGIKRLKKTLRENIWFLRVVFSFRFLIDLLPFSLLFSGFMQRQ